jgi:serine/threonine protein kinase
MALQPSRSPFKNKMQIEPIEELKMKLSDYTIISTIGSGSQGTTYKAKDSSGRIVAIKEFSISKSKTWKQFDSSQKEIRALKNLSHTNIVKYIDDFQTDDGVYIVMEFVEGESLVEKKLKECDVIDFLKQSKEVLSYLSEQHY